MNIQITEKKREFNPLKLHFQIYGIFLQMGMSMLGKS